MPSPRPTRASNHAAARRLALASAACLLGGVILLLARPTAQVQSPGSAPAEAPTVPIQLRDRTYTVELARTPEQRARGLMDRPVLQEDQGMLFLGSHPQPMGIWMKNTLVPLDLFFLDEDFRVLDIYHAVPPCKADPCPVYRPRVPATHVLELAGGQSRTLRVRLGDQVIVPPHWPDQAAR